jgi:glycolate oxidase FAD binding subunit
MVIRPRDADDLVDAVAQAVDARRTLEILGTGSRRGFGRPVIADEPLDLSALSGVVVYEPNELVLTVRAATPMAEIRKLLAAERQHLAFEPPDLGPLWGLAEGQGTIGGALATGLGGPRRVSAGAPRDHFLGFKGVNGFGEAFAAGGRVVKNVTGYDLPKLMAGSFGTLAVLAEVTVKVLPAPEQTLTLGGMGLDEATGLQALRDALGGAVQVSGAAYLPSDAEPSRTLIRLEGPAPAVEAGAARLTQQLARSGGEIVRTADTHIWREIGEARAFAQSAAPVWRLSIPPAAAPALGEALRAMGVQRFYYDWGGGAVWLEGPAEAPDAGAAAIRALLPPGSHATLIRAAAPVRAAAGPFQPLDPGVAALTQRVKRRFDPEGVFNPGRMYAGL